MKIGDKVRLTETAKKDNYFDMDWCNDDMIITHAHKDNEGLGLIFSFDSIESSNEITCSMYAYELELI